MFEITDLNCHWKRWFLILLPFFQNGLLMIWKLGYHLIGLLIILRQIGSNLLDCIMPSWSQTIHNRNNLTVVAQIWSITKETDKLEAHIEGFAIPIFSLVTGSFNCKKYVDVNGQIFQSFKDTLKNLNVSLGINKIILVMNFSPFSFTVIVGANLKLLNLIIIKTWIFETVILKHM